MKFSFTASYDLMKSPFFLDVRDSIRSLSSFMCLLRDATSAMRPS